MATVLRPRPALLLVLIAVLVAAIVAARVIPAIARSGNQSTAARPWMNASLTPQQRAQLLLAQMTMAEKVGQMDQIDVAEVTDTSTACTGQNGFNLPNPTCMQNVFIDNHVGSILAGGTDNPPDTSGKGGTGNTGRDWATEYNTMQQFAIRHSRLHIPVLFGVDAVHGFGHPFQAPLFPHSLGMGATWDLAMAQAAASTTRNALAATGWVWDYAPVQDPSRDNRWGRYYETWSEEPALSAALGGAFVRGLQSTAKGQSLKVTATVKHFAGYSESINGHDRVGAQLPLRYLQDQFLPSYAGAIDAGAGAVMVDSGSINGVPATASSFLLTDILRHRLGFKGVVISDYGDVPALASTYHIVPDLAAAVAAAVNAGIDVSMEPFNPDQFQAAILNDVQNHRITVSRINESVLRVLTLKFKLGLFDQPCARNPSTPCVNAGAADAAVTDGRAATLKAARESITLLRNQNNVLPLSSTSKVVVTGPSADSMTNQLGGWSVSWQGVYGAGHSCCMGPTDQIPPGTTVLAGLQHDDHNVTFASDQAAAVADAASANAIVVVVGEKAYAEGLGDNPAPALPADQEAEISALEATKKPVVVVVIAGRPLDLGPAVSASAIVMAYQGSTEAGQAVADAVFGKVDPGGRLPVTWPSSAAAPGADFATGAPSPPGDEPKVFDQLPGTNSGQGSGYNPLFPFGFGLSYTTFRTSGLSAPGSATRNGRVTVSFTVANTGNRAGTDVVPVYIHQPVSAVLVPNQRLAGFARVTLAAGQSRTAHVSFPVSELAVTPGDIGATAAPRVEAGIYQVIVGSDQRTLTIR